MAKFPQLKKADVENKHEKLEINLLLVSAESHAQTAREVNLNKVNNAGEVRETFRNLFNSVAGDEMGKSGPLRDVLRGEIAKELHDFDAMKEDLRMSRNRNTNRMKNPNNRIVMAAIKREAVQNENNTCENEETTEPGDEESEVTEPEYRYAYLKGDRQIDVQFETADEAFRAALKNIEMLFWSEKCHISEIRFQLKKLNIEPPEKMNQTMNELISIMSDHGENILNILRDDIASSERVDPIGSNTTTAMAGLFKDLRSQVEKLVPSENASEETKIIWKEARLADEQFVEGYGIVREAIRNTTLPWPQPAADTNQKNKN